MSSNVGTVVIIYNYLRMLGIIPERGDPVNIVSGNVVHRETDMFIPCPGIDLAFRRTYNSTSSETNSAMGARWMHWYQWSVATDSNNLQVTTGEGRVLHMEEGTDNSGKLWKSALYNNWIIRQDANSNEYTLYLENELEALFNTNNLLKSITDPWGNTVTLTYTNTNEIVSVEHSNGHKLEFEYTSNKVSKVTASVTNFYMTFAYNSKDELTNATRYISGDSFTTTYAYDSSTNYWNHSLTQRVNAAGDTYSWAYETNASGQITSVCTNTVVGSNYFENSMEYYGSNGYSVLTVTRNSGDQVYTNYFNTNSYFITQEVGPNSTNLVKTCSYNEGYWTITNELVEDKSSGDYLETSREYDDLRRVASESVGYGATPSNEWTYTWDEDYDVITLITDPMGRKTGFEYINGLVAKTKLHYDSSSNSYDTVFTYTTNGLLSSTTNANGNWIKYYYDSYGFPTSTRTMHG